MKTLHSSEAGYSQVERDEVRPSVYGDEPGLSYIRRACPRSGYHTAFVLSGGGARGALQVGALRALLEYGERPDVVVGTSIGAWNAAWLARTPTPEGVEALADAWCGLQPAQVMLGRAKSWFGSLRSHLLCSALRRVAHGLPSLYSNTGLRQMVQRYLGDATFEDMTVPLRIIAANLTHGGRAVFERGSVVPAVLASSAIPGIFPPVRIDDSLYSDGGTVDGCSVETAVELGARRIFVLAIGYDTEGDGGAVWSEAAHEGATDVPDGKTPYSMAAVLQRASQVMGNYQIQRELERLPEGVEAHVISLSTGTGNGTLDFSNVSEWIERAYNTTREYLRTHLPARESDPASEETESRVRVLSA
jgi:NTE family protein